jgi:hypothetical protein
MKKIIIDISRNNFGVYRAGLWVVNQKGPCEN